MREQEQEQETWKCTTRVGYFYCLHNAIAWFWVFHSVLFILYRALHFMFLGQGTPHLWMILLCYSILRPLCIGFYYALFNKMGGYIPCFHSKKKISILETEKTPHLLGILLDSWSTPITWKRE